MRLKTFTVSQVNTRLAEYVSSNPLFGALSVIGEIIDFKPTNYGYAFFSLKDENSRIRAMVYDNVLSTMDLKDGDVIVANGRINFYKKSGSYTLLVKKIEKKGRGSNSEQLEKLFAQLSELGYFDESGKKSIPKYPSTIGVVTSVTGAALQDIIAVISGRFPKVDLIVYHAKMQGDEVDEEVASALDELNTQGVDTIILSRGGGDTDDLSAFNSRLIADAVFRSKIPVISAIGHEIDTFISDFVSDKRAATPSRAAELSVPDLNVVLRDIDNLGKDIENSYKRSIQKERYVLHGVQSIIEVNSPAKKIYEKKLAISDMNRLIRERYADLVRSYKEKILRIEALLMANDYEKILEKGFAVVRKDGAILSDSENLAKNDDVTIEFKSGKVRAKVSEIFR